jgi:ribonucleoside-diphosphate reductase beta chain
MNVEIYSKPNCPFCTKAKNWFKTHGFTYTENVLYTEDQMLAMFQKVPGARSVPQIFIDDKLIGTYDDLMIVADTIVKKTGGGLMEFSETYKPFYYPWAVELTTNHESMHWIEDEIDLSEDVSDWKGNKITRIEKEYITNILRLFTQSDVAVGQNYYDVFIPKFKNNEIRNMLGSFAAREGIHQRAYALLNETLGLPDSEYHAFLEYKEMNDKVDFMMENDSNTLHGTGLALAKMVFNEGISLFASFVMLLNFQRFGKMKGMGKIVEWSIRDESIHVEGNSKLFKAFCAEHSRIVDSEFKAEIYKMAKTAVKLEDKFIDLAYETGKIEGLEAEEVKQYIRYITDRRLLQLGLKPNFKVKDNPLPWLEWILNGADHTNFFEGRVTEYEVAGLMGTWQEAYEEK